jgi:hypothetical protein
LPCSHPTHFPTGWCFSSPMICRQLHPYVHIRYNITHIIRHLPHRNNNNIRFICKLPSKLVMWDACMDSLTSPLMLVQLLHISGVPRWSNRKHQWYTSVYLVAYSPICFSHSRRIRSLGMAIAPMNICALITMHSQFLLKPLSLGTWDISQRKDPLHNLDDPSVKFHSRHVKDLVLFSLCLYRHREM